jgi:hypothetical protein
MLPGWLGLSMEAPAAGSAPLCPPYDWIAASAGMTDYARITSKLCFIRAAHGGVQRGMIPRSKS